VFTIAEENHGIRGTIKTIPIVFSPFAYEHAVACILGVYAVIWVGKWRDRCGIFFLVSVAAAVIMALMPLRLWPEYFSPAALFIFVLYSQGELSIVTAQRKTYIIPALTVAAIGVASNGLSLGSHMRNSYLGTEPSIYQVVKINNSLRAFRDTHELCDDKVFSLAGALVADSGFRLARNMEEFWPRLNGYVPQSYFEDPDYHIDRALLDPASWVLSAGIRFWVVGYDPGSTTEIKLGELAREHGYETQALPNFGPQRISLIFDPGCVRDGTQSGRVKQSDSRR